MRLFSCFVLLLTYASTVVRAGGGQVADQQLSSLLVACRDGDCQSVQARLLENPSLACRVLTTDVPEQKFTALDVAAAGGYAEIVRLLLAAGADANSRCGEGATPLMQVCLQRYAKGAELPVHLLAPESEPPLKPTDTCPRDYLHCLRLLINNGADLNATDQLGDCALFYCTTEGNRELLTELLEHGARMDGWQSSMNDPLCAAAFGGHIACVKALLVAGSPIVTGKKYGFSALHDAAQNGHVEILEHLLQQGVSADAEGSPSGGAPLLIAASEGQLACMRVLLAFGAGIDRPDQTGCTALYRAAQQGQLEALELLLAQGANVYGWFSYRNDPLYAAAFHGQTACVKALLAAGSQIVTGREYGFSALSGAAYNGHAEILQYLLQQGVSANAEGEPSGAAPLSIASYKGQLACMQALLAAGADIDRPDADGCTALYCAAHEGQLEALKLLLSQGANVQGCCSYERDPLCTAAFHGHMACVQTLLRQVARLSAAENTVSALLMVRPKTAMQKF